MYWEVCHLCRVLSGAWPQFPWREVYNPMMPCVGPDCCPPAVRGLCPRHCRAILPSV